MASNSTFEPETMDAVKKWFAGMGQVAYGMSPLSLPELETQAQDDQNSDENQEILGFLDGVKERFGSRSLVYVSWFQVLFSISDTCTWILTPFQISFGTFSHPPEPEKLEAVIETFISTKTPFYLCHASPLPIATLSDKLQKLITESGFGMAKKWSPQQAILQHEATGWFITHGGWNGTQEGFTSRVPM